MLARHSGRKLGALVDADRRSIDRIRHGAVPRPEHRAALLRLAVGLATVTSSDTVIYQI